MDASAIKQEMLGTPYPTASTPEATADQQLAHAMPTATFLSQMGVLLRSSAPLGISLPPLAVPKARVHA